MSSVTESRLASTVLGRYSSPPSRPFGAGLAEPEPTPDPAPRHYNRIADIPTGPGFRRPTPTVAPLPEPKIEPVRTPGPGEEGGPPLWPTRARKPRTVKQEAERRANVADEAVQLAEGNREWNRGMIDAREYREPNPPTTGPDRLRHCYEVGFKAGLVGRPAKAPESPAKAPERPRVETPVGPRVALADAFWWSGYGLAASGLDCMACRDWPADLRAAFDAGAAESAKSFEHDMEIEAARYESMVEALGARYHSDRFAMSLDD